MVELTAGERLLAKLLVTVEHGLGRGIPEHVICQMANDIQSIAGLGIRLEVALIEATILADPELARREGITHSNKTWLDVVDMGLCHLSAAAPGRYTELIEQAHGWIQCVLAGTAPMETLLAAAVMPANDEEAE
jgi:hypothetical protein